GFERAFADFSCDGRGLPIYETPEGERQVRIRYEDGTARDEIHNTRGMKVEDGSEWFVRSRNDELQFTVRGRIPGPRIPHNDPVRVLTQRNLRLSAFAEELSNFADTCTVFGINEGVLDTSNVSEAGVFFFRRPGSKGK
ncbi:hypothetical protein H0H92_010554, partial [Tricholoma furcatifolium]